MNNLTLTLPIVKKNYQINFVNLIIFVSGALSQFIAYQSINPLIFKLIVSLIGLAILFLFFREFKSYLGSYLKIIFVGMLVSGISAYFGNYLHDEMHSYSDAKLFYELSSGKLGFVDIEYLRQLSDGAGAILLWQYFYVLSDYLGFENDRYVGISVNVVMIAMSCVLGIKTLRLIFENDKIRESRFVNLFALSGMIWLFQSYHLRDASVMLVLGILIYYWVSFLSNSSSSGVIKLLIVNLLCSFCLYYLRDEFSLVPLAMLLASVLSKFFSVSKTQLGRQSEILITSLGLFLFIIILIFYKDRLFSSAMMSSLDYKELAVSSSAENSLGVSLIMNQILPIKIILGSFYLFLFPIPIWVGFQFDSAYFLYKSFNTIFLYFTTPLMLLSTNLLYNNRSYRKTPMLFLLLVFLGFVLVIAATSLETRHFGVFFPIFFIICLLPDLNDKVINSKYVNYCCYNIIFIAAVHGLWFVLKYI